MALGDYLDVIVLGVDSLLAYAFYRTYKSVRNEADFIENAPTYEIGKELNNAINEAPDKCLPYVTIVGKVRALEQPVYGIQSSMQGVVSCNEMFEHRQNISDRLQSLTDVCRFALVNPKVQTSEVNGCVEVTNAMESDYLMESLPVVYSSYEPFQSSVLSRSLDIITGNLIRGHHLTERILKEDTTLLAVGRVYTVTTPVPILAATKTDVCLNPGLQIGPPLDDKYPFVLSLMNKNQVVQSIRGRSKMFRVAYYAFSTIGVGLLAYIVYKMVKKWKIFEKSSTAEMGVNPSYSINSPSYTGESPCVVCLTSAKDLVLMPCRHMCVCSACFENIPTPKKCPVCRAEVKEKIAVFIP